MNLLTSLKDFMSKKIQTQKEVKIPYKIDFVEPSAEEKKENVIEEKPTIIEDTKETIIEPVVTTENTVSNSNQIDSRYIPTIEAIQEFKCKSGHRVVTQIAVHCTATQEGKRVSIEEIDSWHKKRGFTKQKISGHYCGYHFVIDIDGTIMFGRNLQEVGAHVENFNKNSIGICYVGGLDKNGKAKDTRTIQQKESLKWLISYLKRELKITIVKGHRDYPNVAKACPCFNAIPEYITV